MYSADATRYLLFLEKITIILIIISNLLPFLTTNSDPYTIAKPSNQFLLRLYDCSARNSNSKCVYAQNLYYNNVQNSKYYIANLPPTKAIAEKRLYRTYRQVQLWQGNKLKAEEWDWKGTHTGLSLVTSFISSAPR